MGNKCDLLNDREVTTDEGRKLAEQMKAIFLETSAKNNQARTTTTYNGINIYIWLNIIKPYKIANDIEHHP